MRGFARHPAPSPKRPPIHAAWLDHIEPVRITESGGEQPERWRPGGFAGDAAGVVYLFWSHLVATAPICPKGTTPGISRGGHVHATAQTTY